MSLRDDLIAARALIDTEEKWTRGAFQTGSSCCVAGAVRKVVRSRYPGMEWDDSALWFALSGELPVSAGNPVIFNDDPRTTHADIMALFDRAIEAAP